MINYFLFVNTDHLFVLINGMCIFEREKCLYEIKVEDSKGYLKGVLIFHTVHFLVSKQHILTYLPSTYNQNISCLIFIYSKQF